MQTMIANQVSEYILKHIDQDQLDPAIHLFEEGLVSSLFAIQLMSYLENNFDIEITGDDLDLEYFKSVDCIVDFVNGKKSA